MFSQFLKTTISLFILFSISVKVKSQTSPSLATIDLKGTWKFALDLNDEGIHKKWYLGNLTDRYLGNVLLSPNEDVSNKFVTSLTDEIVLPSTTDIAGWGTPDQSPWINYLQRKHKYIGAVWYQKILEIPKDWENYNTELFLERTKWQSRVWIDGKELSKPEDGLVTSHHHHLGKLSPGTHLVAIRIDNRMIHPIGDKGHNYTEQTESIWNGIIGKILLVKKANIGADRVRVFANYSLKKITAEIDIRNAEKKNTNITINLAVKDQSGKIIKNISVTRKLNSGILQKEKIEIPFNSAKPWDEFSPNTYTLAGNISSINQTENIEPITFGFRDLSTNRYKFFINKKPIYIRGNQEALGYPQTGHPPMEVEEWKRIFNIYKSYGLNQVRFHSSCPPRAAFEAADQLGIYIMAELVWMTSINAKQDLRPISATMGIPKGIGNNDRTLDDFIKRETRKLLDEFGNHPSFCFFSYGNEMDNLNKQVVNEWISDLKKDDPRRLYAATTARAVLPADDFQDSHIVPGKGSVVNKSGNPSTISNYDSAYVHTNVPIIAHELGQFPVYPNWKEIAKYEKTPFRFINLEKSLKLAQENKIVQQNQDFIKASGHLQQMLYKEEIERQFRSKYSAGFNLLQMNDYTGQGEALVGWLDAFYDSKGITTPEKFREFCNDIVVLAKFPKRIFRDTATLNIAFQLANNSNATIRTAIKWELLDSENTIIKTGELDNKRVNPGELADFETVNINFPPSSKAQKYTVRAYTANKQYKNEWDFWTFNQLTSNKEYNISICNTIEEALIELKKGKKVLFIADKAGNPNQKYLSSFKPVFWSTLFFPGNAPQTLGALIDNKHPALKAFPTDQYLDWQWQNICNTSRGTILDGEAINIKPIIQPIDDFHSNRKLASLYEVKVGKGKLLICGYNLDENANAKFEVQHLKKSLLDYMESDLFNPSTEISTSWLISKYEHTSTDKQENSKSNLKVNLPQSTYLKALSPLKFEINTTTTTIGYIYIKVSSEKSNTNLNLVVDGRKTSHPLTKKEEWIKAQYFREDFDDQKLLIELNAEDKSNKITITEIKMEAEN